MQWVFFKPKWQTKNQLTQKASKKFYLLGKELTYNLAQNDAPGVLLRKLLCLISMLILSHVLENKFWNF